METDSNAPKHSPVAPEKHLQLEFNLIHIVGATQDVVFSSLGVGASGSLGFTVIHNLNVMVKKTVFIYCFEKEPHAPSFCGRQPDLLTTKMYIVVVHVRYQENKIVHTELINHSSHPYFFYFCFL